MCPEKDYSEFPNLRETDKCVWRDDMAHCLRWLDRYFHITYRKDVYDCYVKLKEKSRECPDSYTLSSAIAIIEDIFYNPEQTDK